jgi:DNA modification methylase
MTIEEIKKLGKNKNKENFLYLLELYKKDFSAEIKREIISSIGRQNEIKEIYCFIQENYKKCSCMDYVYQMYRTCLYKDFFDLQKEIEKYYNNEYIFRMKNFFNYKEKNIKNIKNINHPLLLVGDNRTTLKKIDDKQVDLIFTSPPYYNAREYSNYKSYNKYLEDMEETIVECNRVLDDGRFMIVNVSPVITKRAGREFESIRYPIPFDFHNILSKNNFYFIDEIIWIKPEASVPNRNGGYQQTLKPLAYKPNCITESILVYRKNVYFLLDKNISWYSKKYKNDNNIDNCNCWYIRPEHSKKHSAIFPKELCRRILKYYSYSGDVVLDPFSGSGTFGNIAIENGRIPIMCEINEEYAKLYGREYERI